MRDHIHETVRMEDLCVGDTIEVWWQPGRDTIIGLRPYTGPIKCIERAKLADFAIVKVGMTLEPGALYVRVAHAGVPLTGRKT